MKGEHYKPRGAPPGVGAGDCAKGAPRLRGEELLGVADRDAVACHALRAGRRAGRGREREPFVSLGERAQFAPRVSGGHKHSHWNLMHY